MLLTFVEPNGNTNSVESKLSILEMIQMHHTQGMSWYNFKTPEITIAGKAGLNYTQIEKLRRSQTWREEATNFIKSVDGLELTDDTLKNLGCMPPQRKSQPQKGNRNGKSGMSKDRYATFGENVVREMVAREYAKLPENKVVTLDWANESFEVYSQAFNLSNFKLPPLPDKPKAQTQAEKNAELLAEIERLKAQLAAKEGE